DGNQIQFLPSGKLNNVDLRDGFQLAGSGVPLVTAGNRTDNSIGIFALDPATRQLRDVAARKITTITTYGSCMYKSPVSGKYYYFVDAKDGNIQQWELFATAAGTVDATKVRDLHQLASQPEACAVDDEAKALFVGEEATGVWRFDAEPNVTSGSGFDGVLIASTAPGGHLVRDVEGVAIAKTSATGGYIFVSNQGVSTYSVFSREAPYSYVKTFRVERGAACVDAVTGSDGIEVSTANLGPAFPHGVFVTQDDSNDGLNQNFKLVPLEHILSNAPAVDDSACSSGGGGSGGASGAGGNSGSGGAASSGYGEPFCTTFCNKCASCYATGTFSEGDCVFHQVKTAFTLDDCQAGCAVSATPGAAAKAALSPGFETMSCADFDGAM
ncbi:MAG TPA: phytase, partial [Polyangiaceae bacterium]